MVRAAFRSAWHRKRRQDPAAHTFIGATPSWSPKASIEATGDVAGWDVEGWRDVRNLTTHLRLEEVEKGLQDGLDALLAMVYSWSVQAESWGRLAGLLAWEGDEQPLQHKEFVCGAKPLGHNGPTCGASAKDHAIGSSTVQTRSGEEVPQHNFIAVESGRNMSNVGVV